MKWMVSSPGPGDPAWEEDEDGALWAPPEKRDKQSLSHNVTPPARPPLVDREDSYQCSMEENEN